MFRPKRAGYAHDKIQYAAMAQQVERVLGKDEVTGSNPVSSSNRETAIFCGFSFHVSQKEHFL